MAHPIEEKRFSYRGHDCVVLFQSMGFRTAYVNVHADHPAYGRRYDDLDIDCHGGLTYGECHLPHEDQNTGWWIGFDCGHCIDGYDVECMRKYYAGNDSVLHMAKLHEASWDSQFPVRTLDYCVFGCEAIVDQLLDYAERFEKGDKQ